MNGHEVLWTESGWYIRPEVPQPSSDFDEEHDFWHQLHQVLEYIEPPDDSDRELSLEAVAA